ncbi:hypothetical protein DV735_g4312, partial [Chaetothyriales sp. CBS 134920]
MADPSISTGYPFLGPAIDARIVPFFESFYAVSDDPSEAATRAYVEDHLTPSATLIMGAKRADGREAITALRQGLWAANGPVISRKHTVGQLYPFGGGDSLDVVLYGVVDYGLRNGKTGVRVDWAARAVFEEDQGEGNKLRMKFYQVYLDSAVVAAAIKD